MVKKWMIMIALIVALVVGCILEHNYVNNSFKWLINSAESLQIELSEHKDQIDTDEYIWKVNQIHLEWEKRARILKCLIWHSGIKDIEVDLARISVYIEENNYTEAYAEIASLIDYTAHYLDDFRVSTENIF